MRTITDAGTQSYLHAVLRTFYAQLGHDPETTLNLPWVSADLVFQAAHPFGDTSFRDFFKYASEIPYVQLNRLTTSQPKIRLAASVR